MSKICILIPCYNEENNIEVLNLKLQETISSLTSSKYEFELLFVNDGSQDKTLEKIRALQLEFKNVKYISLTRNFGHQNAIKAGIDKINADVVITMDADMQHPPLLINELINYWEKGFDIVNTKRLETKSQTWLKKKTSTVFYRMINYLSYVHVEPGTADFRLLDKKVIEELKKWNEQNLFYRGILPWLGFKQHTISYEPDERYTGKSKYTFKKMISFAMSGVTSFSIRPLRLSILIGVLLSILSVTYMIYALYISVFTERAIQGWTSVIVSILFIGGLQLLILGIMGEYLGKLYIENKKRPNYIIDETDLKHEED
jgi:dolichol-phosphate mannosyltransferase